MRKLLIGLIIAASLVIPVSPSSAHMDDWHPAACNPTGGPYWLYYKIPSQWGGSRVEYFKAYYGYTLIDQPFLQKYAESGYECGWMGQVTHNASIHTICEFGYCGTGTEQYLQRARMLRHFGGWAAGRVVVYSR